MNKHNKRSIKILAIFLVIASVTVTYSLLSETPLKTTGISGQSSLIISQYSCDDFEGSTKLFNQMETFQFTFQSTQMSYGLYLAAMFVCEGDAVTLYVYAFVKTLTDDYVSNLPADFTFTLTGSYKSVPIYATGKLHDTAPMLTSDPCLYEFFLDSEEFTKESGSDLLSLSIDYRLNSTGRFDESDTYSCSKSMSECIPFMSFYLIIAVGLAMFLVYVRNRQKYAIKL